MTFAAAFAGCRYGGSPEPSNTDSLSVRVTKTAEASLGPGTFSGVTADPDSSPYPT